MNHAQRATILTAVTLTACGGSTDAVLAQNPAFDVEVVADLDAPWALGFLPDGRLLVTEMRGELLVLDGATQRIVTLDLAQVEAAR